MVSNALNVTNPECDPAIRTAVQQVEKLTLHRVGWNMLTRDFK